MTDSRSRIAADEERYEALCAHFQIVCSMDRMYAPGPDGLAGLERLRQRQVERKSRAERFAYGPTRLHATRLPHGYVVGLEDDLTNLRGKFLAWTENAQSAQLIVSRLNLDVKESVEKAYFDGLFQTTERAAAVRRVLAAAEALIDHLGARNTFHHPDVQQATIELRDAVGAHHQAALAPAPAPDLPPGAATTPPHRCDDDCPEHGFRAP